MLHVKLDTSPLINGHGGRGIGRYTRSLQEALEQETDVELIPADDVSVAPDVVHYPFFDLFFSTLPVRQKAPTVVTIHDVIPLMFPEQYRPGVKGRARLLKQRLALRSVKAVITDSEFSKQQILRYLRIRPEKVSVVMLAADEKLIKASPRELQTTRSAFSLPEKYILYVGDINYNKNIPQLIKCVKFLPEDIHLVCVGANFKPQPIPEWQWIETQMAMSDVTDRVHFVSEIPVGDSRSLSAMYTGAVAYVQPSLAEGFGLPVLEAMQCQTPVVATNTSSLGEVGGESALYCEPTAEALAEQVEVILGWSATHRRKWLAEAFSWSQTFSWSKVAKETVQVYSKVANVS